MRYLHILALLALIGCGDVETTNKGDLYFERGEFELAVSSYADLLENDPSNTSFLYNRGRSYEELGIINSATADFDKIVKIDPKHVNALLSLSKISYEKGDYSKAAIHASTVLKHESSAKAHFLSARAAHQLGYADQALESYNSAISIDKEYGEAFLYRGALKIGKSRPKSACEDFRRAKSLDVEGAESAIKDYCS